MAARLSVCIHEGRSLPVMNTSSQLTDAYVEIRFKDQCEKTSVARKTLNPKWDETFRFSIDNKSIQDEVLEINIWDHDKIGQDDAIGQITIDLLPLVPYNGSKISGWFPIYDTLNGVRGQLAVTVKLKIIKDQNKYRDTSVGVTFYSSAAVPDCCKVIAVRGFVEELIVKDDPEYQWIDRVRPTRQSNQARQNVFTNLTGELQRKVGRKAIDLQANAVVGYRQLFDLEGESGLVARGIGTAVLVLTMTQIQENNVKTMLKSKPIFENALPPLRAESSSANVFSRTGFDDQVPVSLITLCDLPDGLVTSIGGVVSARAVKLLNKIENPEETDTRDAWWSELRNEIAGHARSLGYSAVVGYAETTSIHDNLCLLSATGTAAVLNTNPSSGAAIIFPETPVNRQRRASTIESTSIAPTPTVEGQLSKQTSHIAEFDFDDDHDDHDNHLCSCFHLPPDYSVDAYASFATTCTLCNSSTVPEVLFTTINPLKETPIIGTATTVQARVCRKRTKKSGGYENAKELGESMPFIEYSLHQQLYNKLRILAMNALFNLKIEVTIGSKLICVVATATAMHLACLPTPRKLKIIRTMTGADDTTEAQRIQGLIERGDHNHAAMEERRMQHSYGNNEDFSEIIGTAEDDIIANRTLSNEATKKSVVIEIDDAVDRDEIASLLDTVFPNGFFYSNTDTLLGLETEHKLEEDYIIDTITVVNTIELDPTGHVNLQFSNIFDDILVSLWFKLRKFDPCCIASARWAVAFPEPFEVQVSLTATIIKLRRIQRTRVKSTSSAFSLHSHEDNDASVKIDDMELPSIPRPDYLLQKTLSTVHVTSCATVPGLTVVQHLGPVIMYMIKETTSLRDVGGISKFVHLFIREVLSLAKAHVRSRGGNALVGYRVRDLDIIHTQQKNQAQCLIALQGDAILCVKEIDDILPILDSEHEHEEDHANEHEEEDVDLTASQEKMEHSNVIVDAIEEEVEEQEEEGNEEVGEGEGEVFTLENDKDPNEVEFQSSPHQFSQSSNTPAPSSTIDFTVVDTTNESSFKKKEDDIEEEDDDVEDDDMWKDISIV
eukprot:m.83568 g.83568  ORF g.83568 m.83568 type:complete len:1062 (-) comp8694_c0_seq2:261-3446(-)